MHSAAPLTDRRFTEMIEQLLDHLAACSLVIKATDTAPATNRADEPSELGSGDTPHAADLRT